MENKKAFEGIFPALFSIYDENLNVKKDSVKKLVEFDLKGGVGGFYVCGNTGECAVLPARTRKQMLDAVIEANAGRGKIMAHIGAGHLDETLDLLADACSKPVDAVASLPPALMKYYSRDEIIDYYKLLAAKSTLPVYAYVTPVLNCDLTDFAREISEIDNIAGIKISIPDYYSFGKITRLKGGALNILNGPDETMICGLAVGADGAIGTTYNFAPAHAVSMYEAFRKGDMASLREKQAKLNKIIDIALGHNIGYWKAIMTTRGFDMGYTVAPATQWTSEDLAALKAKLDEAGFDEISRV